MTDHEKAAYERRIAAAIYEAFGIGDDRPKGQYLVEITQAPDLVHVKAYGEKVLAEFIADDVAEITVTETTADGWERTARLSPTGQIACTERGFDPVSNRISYSEVDMGPLEKAVTWAHVVGIAERVLPLVRPLAGPIVTGYRPPPTP
jgi:hypothetical protein